MKKILLSVIAGITLVFASACNNPDTTDSTEERINAAIPVITSHPQGAEYYVDDKAIDLTVIASTSDGGTLSYQWYSNNKNNNQTGKKIAGASGANYSPSTTESDLVYYYVIVTNTIEDNGDGGNKTAIAVSKTAGIEVIETINAVIPNIIRQPQGAVYSEGAPAVDLTVTASNRNEGTLSYQWYSNTDDDNKTGMLISNATKAYYKPPTSTLEIKYYYVVVTNTIEDNGDGGKKVAITVSDTAKIEVNNKINAEIPIIIGHPHGAIYHAGQPLPDLTVTVSPLSDGGTLSYQWYSNTSNTIKAGMRISGATNNNYKPPNNIAGEMYYYVIVTNIIVDNGDGGNKEASTISNVAELVLN